MRRSDIVRVAPPGDHGKPRPALIVQSDLLNDEEPSSYLVCPLTTTLAKLPDIRVHVEPTPANGLSGPSEVMIDKLSTAPRRRLRGVVGRLDPATMRTVDRALLLVLGFA